MPAKIQVVKLSKTTDFFFFRDLGMDVSRAIFKINREQQRREELTLLKARKRVHKELLKKTSRIPYYMDMYTRRQRWHFDTLDGTSVVLPTDIGTIDYDQEGECRTCYDRRCKTRYTITCPKYLPGDWDLDTTSGCHFRSGTIDHRVKKQKI